MIITQKELLRASLSERSANDYLLKRPSGIPVIHILHSFEDFRLVEGMINHLKSANIDAYFQWESGYDLSLLQSNVAVNEKAQIVGAQAVILLATFKSLQDEKVRDNLSFARSAQKRVYVFPTVNDDEIYGESLYPEFPVLYMEERTMGGALNLKVKKPDQKNFLRLITSARML
ncbi:MAG: hypothetical protein PQJ47_08255 [Sphaerochaetaceae bacterium]|nr:hypothetical protein [Sphaerochaetaceae bacterium]MDC7247926.1 hypothetical protein [Sphaerochaetaceae bacterium]